MDRADLSAAIRQEMETVFMAALAEAWPVVLTSDLAGMEQRLRQVGRVGALRLRQRHRWPEAMGAGA